MSIALGWFQRMRGDTVLPLRYEPCLMFFAAGLGHGC